MERRPLLPRVLTLLWAVAAALIATGGPAAAAEAVRINGSGSALDMMKPLVAAYAKTHPGVRFEMERPLGSSGAIKALLADAMDLVVSSKVLTADQAAQDAQAREYGRTPLAIVAHAGVSHENITTRELEAIYAGKLTTWAGGERIRVVLRPETDIDTAILRGLSPGLSAAMDAAQSHPGMLRAVTDPESNDTVARTPGGIGASGLSGVLAGSAALKVLSLNGVKPSVKTLANRSYPLAKEIHFVTKGRPSAAVEDLLAFVYSAKGRAIAEKAGVLVTSEARSRP